MEEKEVLDVLQLKNIVDSVEQRELVINELRAENNRLKSQQGDLSEMLEKYSKFAKLIDEPPVKYLNLTLRNSDDLQRFYIRLKKDLQIDGDGDNSNAIKKTEHVIGFLFWWVVNDGTRWQQMINLYKQAMK